MGNIEICINNINEKDKPTFLKYLGKPNLVEWDDNLVDARFNANINLSEMSNGWVNIDGKIKDKNNIPYIHMFIVLPELLNALLKEEDFFDWLNDTGWGDHLMIKLIKKRNEDKKARHQ
jgi:hypothetical protein